MNRERNISVYFPPRQYFPLIVPRHFLDYYSTSWRALSAQLVIHRKQEPWMVLKYGRIIRSLKHRSYHRVSPIFIGARCFCLLHFGNSSIWPDFSSTICLAIVLDKSPRYFMASTFVSIPSDRFSKHFSISLSISLGNDSSSGGRSSLDSLFVYLGSNNRFPGHN